jgi:hypothetical protein
MSSVRTRLENADLAARYAAQQTGPSPEQVEQERRERLAHNARVIRENNINSLLLDMTDDEREVVFIIIGRERPDSLGSADVIQATLERVRAEGIENLRAVMEGTSRDEQRKVWEILKTTSAESRLGMDGGDACREALRQVRIDEYLGG